MWYYPGEPMNYNFEHELTAMKAEWKENLDELHLLFSIAKEISFTRNLDLLLDQIVGRVAQVMRAEAASLLLMNTDTMQLDFKIVKGQRSEALRNLDIHLRPGEGLAGWVMATNQYAISNKPSEDARFKYEIDRMTSFETRNLLAVPMRGEGGALGVIEVINRLEGKDFTEHDAQFLGSVAWLSAMAIENAQMYSMLERSEGHMVDILENLPGGYIGVDMKGLVTKCNARALEVFGLPRNLIGQKYTQALAAQPDAVKAIERAFVENQGTKRQQFYITSSRMDRRQIGYSTLAVRNRAGETEGIGLLFQDITEFIPGA